MGDIRRNWRRRTNKYKMLKINMNRTMALGTSQRMNGYRIGGLSTRVVISIHILPALICATTICVQQN